MSRLQSEVDGICKWILLGCESRLIYCNIAFQQIEIEESTDMNHGPIIRLFGVNQAGNSVLATVHGFRPYFYVPAPAGFMNRDLDSLKDTLNVIWQSSIQDLG